MAEFFKSIKLILFQIAKGWFQIISKKTKDDGWWKGEVNGKKGVFPENFVEKKPSARPSNSGGG